MTLFSYEIFDTVARLGSFNKAATQLHLTPSAISHAVAVMEEELGSALFNRGKNGVTLTSYGESLYPSIRNVLNSNEALMQSVAQLNGLQKGTVRIGTFNSACIALLPSVLKEFSQSHPQIDVEIYQGTYDDIRNWLSTGMVDIGLLSVSSAGEHQLQPLVKDRLMCIAPKGQLQPQNGVITAEALRGCDFVIQGTSVDADIKKYLKMNHLDPASRCHVVDDMSTIAMVEAGLGVAILPQLVLQGCTAAVDIFPLVPEEYRVIGLALQSGDTAAPAVEQMRLQIQACCAKRPDAV